jgi:hypothetical protein
MRSLREHLARLLDLDPTQWQSWFILGVALAIAAFVFYCSYHILRLLTWGRSGGKSKPVHALISDAQAKAPPRPGVIVTRSRGAIKLLLDDPATPQTVLTLRTVRAPANIPWVQVAVLTCKPQGKNYMLQCEFVEPPPWNVVVWLD